MRRAAFGIGFDIDHTLCIDNKLERVAFLHLLDRIANDGGRALGTLSEESATIDALLASQRGGACTIEEAVNRFVRERGASAGSGYAEAFKSMALQMVDAFVVPAPDAKSTIEELRQRDVPVAILSNGWNPLQIAKGRRAGFHGTVLASATLGVQKPQAAAFAALASALGVEAKDCYYVGDDPGTDVAGAANAGMHSVWLDNEAKIYPATVSPPAAAIGSLAELLSILPGASV
ncbi:MAG: HAD family hydrolase [Candidatus Eremiobacteraeota bacterium]|nr:HAD family hydrolase [Candidatus Eremiobacteraeota bacterium]